MAPIYRPLAVSEQEIRLLKLHASADVDSKLSCGLIYRSLQAAGSYEALSYTWGVPEFTQTIKLEGQDFNITKNLETALRHLRLPNEDRILWVDAVCINQNDIAERNHQVTLMKAIYSTCTRDVAWLGPVEEDDDQTRIKLKDVKAGMDLMRTLASRSLDDESAEEFSYDFVDYSYDNEGERLHTQKDIRMLSYERARALGAVFSRPQIWTRIWVMQELACAPSVLLIFGHETLEWSAVTEFLGDTKYADAFHIHRSHDDPAPVTKQILEYAQLIEHQRRILRDVAAGKAESTLLDVLARFKFGRSSDTRDKIYGLLGLVSEKHTIKVDYRKSAEQLFAEVTLFLINSRKDLDIICQNPWQTDRNGRRFSPSVYLPSPSSSPVDDSDDGGNKIATKEPIPEMSWVANFDFASYYDWSNTSGFSRLLFAQRHIFHAGRDRCAVPIKTTQTADGRRAIALRGTIIDRLGRVLPPEMTEGVESWDRHNLFPRRWMSNFFGSSLLDDSAPAYFTGEPARQAFWRTLVTDCRAYRIQRLDAKEIKADDKIFESILSYPETASESDEVQTGRRRLFYDLACGQMWSRNSRSWAFCKSQKGYFLMVRPGAQEGDLIAVLDGGKVPVLLRKAGRVGENDTYFIANVAYVHGFMDGLAQDWVKKGRLEEKELLIV